MDKQSEQDRKYYSEITTSCHDSANQNAQDCNASTTHLNGVLLTVTATMLTIMTLALGNVEVLQKLNTEQKVIITLDLIVFILSIIFGIIANIRAAINSQKLFKQCGEISDKAARHAPFDVLSREIEDINERSVHNVGFGFIIAQFTLFILGILLMMAYVLTVLFTQTQITNTCDQIEYPTIYMNYTTNNNHEIIP